MSGSDPASSSSRALAASTLDLLRSIDYGVFEDRTVYIPALFPEEGPRGPEGGLYPAPAAVRFLAARLAEGVVQNGGTLALAPDDPGVDVAVLVRVDRRGTNLTRRNYQLAFVPVFLQVETEVWLEGMIAAYDLERRTLLSLVRRTETTTLIEPFVLGIFGYRIQF